MAINTSTVETNLTTKLNATSGTTDAKEFLLLGKAVEALQPSVTLSSIQTEGTTQVSNVNTAGTTQVAAVTAEGNTQVAAVQAAGASYAPLAGATFTGDINMGTNDIISTGKILYSNVYNTTGDLPSASTYHGMFAHVHGTGAGYFAHGGNWMKLVNEDTSGNVTIGGNLTVSGTTTTVNSTTLDVADLNITVANGAADAAAADGAGLTVDGASATFTYANTGDKWTMNKPLDVTGAVSATGADINGTLQIEEVKEKVAVDTSTTGTIDFNILDGAIKYFNTNQTANRTVNFRGDASTTLDSILGVGESITVALVMKQGGTAYYLNQTQIDGTQVSGVYAGGTPTGGNTNGSDVYTFTIFKIASNHLVIHGSVTQYTT